MHNPLLFVAVSAVVLAGAAACTPSGPPPVRTALDCPAAVGELSRSAIAPDGKTCAYTSRDGDEVSLRLLPVSGSYQSALQPIEQELSAEVMTDKDQAQARVDAAEAGATAAQAQAGAAADGAKAAAEAARQAAQDARGEAKDAEAAAKDAADAVTHVDLPGIHITADERGKADVNVGAIHVNAGEQGAVIHIDRPTRLRGEALSRVKRGFRATYIIANDNLRNGWRAVGYEAGGPQVGPITVAVVRSRSGEHDHILGDVKRLVRRNAGV